MIYLLYGSNNYLIKKEIEKIKKTINDYDINNYDLENTKIENIIDDALQMNLFNENKIIIIDNSYIFTGTTNKKLLEQNTSILEEYINNQNPTTILIFITNSQKIDERKKITKLLKEKGKIVDLNTNLNIINEIKNELKNYKIDESVIRTFIDRVGDNLDILINELEKIKLYKENDKTITKEDIILLTSKNISTDIFDLIEQIVNKNTYQAYIEYNEIIKNGEEAIKILIMLANQFRIIYQANKLYNKGYTESNIASILDIHPYRIKLALNKSKNYSLDTLLNYLYKLANLDIDIKTGKIDANLALELFILNI